MIDVVGSGSNPDHDQRCFDWLKGINMDRIKA